MTVLEDNALRLQMEKDRKVIENTPTLRDQFAMAALIGYLSAPNTSGEFVNFAKTAYEQADAMLEARKEKR